MYYLPEIFGIGLVVFCHWVLRNASADGRFRFLVACSAAVCVTGLLCNIKVVWTLIPAGPIFMWGRGMAILWAITSSGMILAWMLVRKLARPAVPVDAGRRAILQTAQSAIVAAPALAIGYGSFIGRRNLHAREINLHIAGLPKDLDGLRLAQLSDIHLSSFLSPDELAAAVGMANGFRPHLSLVSGDLITRDGDPLDACIAELSKLRADAGTYGCLGNHEVYANCEAYTEATAARRGIRFLTSQAETLRFGSANLRLAGVPYQKMHSDYLVGADAMRERSAFNLLLSHNPDVFETAAAQGWDLTLAGHTHGGQVTVEYLNQHLNLARFFTPYVYGHYQKENSHIYVTRGIGTVGVPARIGAVPEVALIRLCAT